ncbi:MAG TPA: hypothetical protein VNZ58_08130 [Thermomicrobiales bacterium]|nr:hypothetical protein [Thermomicrobiales bacterium]
MHFCRTDLDDVPVGSWVVVATENGEEMAQVVILPDQLLSDLTPPDALPIVRPVGAAPDLETPCSVSTTGSQLEGRLIGGIGRADPSRRDISREDERFRQLKSAFPRIGQRISAGEGAGTVIEVNVFERFVTIRYDESGETGRVLVADLTNNANLNQEDK